MLQVGNDDGDPGNQKSTLGGDMSDSPVSALLRHKLPTSTQELHGFKELLDTRAGPVGSCVHGTTSFILLP